MSTHDRSSVDTVRNMWRIAVVEDHLLQRRRTEELMNGQTGFEVVHSCETLPDLVRWLAGTRPGEQPHLLLLDLAVDRGVDADPKTVVTLIRSGMRVLVLSAMASPMLVRQMLQAGVSGVVGKRDTEADIISAAWTVLGRRQWLSPELASAIAGDEGRPGLSEQEERVLVLYASGLTLNEVAQAVEVQPGTVKTYLRRIKQKYEAVGRPARSKLDLNRAATLDGYLEAGGSVGGSG